MGLALEVVDAIIREHAHKPIVGDVVLIGRQTISLSPSEAIALVREHGLSVSLDEQEVEIDNYTINRSSEHKRRDLISDRSLFKLLGANRVLALDHSDYEGAEIIHNLTKPVPPALKNSADFIVDGSTIDNVFNPALVLKNLADMLRPGGRIICVNMLSNHHQPYTIPSQTWYLDYFTENGFADCKVYVIVYKPGHPSNSFTINLEYLLDPKLLVSNFVSAYEMCVVVFAEKGAASTTDVWPTQGHYRPEVEWASYRRQIVAMRANPRPHLMRSRGKMSFFDVRGGYLFMRPDYTAADPKSQLYKKLSFRRLRNFARRLALKI